MEKRTFTRIIEDEVFETTNENGNKVLIDMREDTLKSSLGPTELLLAAVSGCVAVDIVAILRKRKKTIQDFSIETSGIRRDTHPRSFTSIHSKYILTSPDVTIPELQKIAGLALTKYCSVADSLKAKVDFSVEIINPKA